MNTKNNKQGFKKLLVLALALVLVISASVGATLAWFTAKTDTVTNTFTSAKLFADPESQFTLWENVAKDEDGDGIFTLSSDVTTEGVETYKILPGVDIPKNPTVTITALEEYAYLYVKVESTLPPDTVKYNFDNWAALDGYTGIYVYNNGVALAPGNHEYRVLAKIDGTENTLDVDPEYTGTGATLNFTAYLVQATGNGADAKEAWGNTFGK